MQKFFVVLLLFISTGAFAQKGRKDVPAAPIPAVIVNAKKVFLNNGGGSDLAYDSFYAEMKKWGRYEIVGSPEEADLIVELSYFVQDRGTHVWSSTNTYTGATQVHSADRRPTACADDLRREDQELTLVGGGPSAIGTSGKE
jgi:hypothetical protein